MVLPSEGSHSVVIIMSKNPYASASDVGEAGEVRSQVRKSRWLLWLGLLTVLLSCLVFFVLISQLFMATSQGGRTPASGPDPAAVAWQGEQHSCLLRNYDIFWDCRTGRSCFWGGFDLASASGKDECVS